MGRLNRLVCLLLCAMFVVSGLGITCSSADSTTLPKSLYTRIDPSTGKVYNLGGKTVYIYDYWSGDADWHNDQPATEEEKVRHKYRKWIEKTYNCKIRQMQKGDWGTQGEELLNFVKTKNKDLCVFIISSDNINYLVANNLAADWKKSVSISLSDSKWNQSTIDYMSFAGGVYGVSTGRSEPRQCLFFNKRVLEEVGIDWNEIYTLQKSGKWTWDKFTAYMQKVQNGTFHGIVGSSDDFYRIAVFSNGGSFFDFNESGELVSTISSANSKEALNWAKSTWKKYVAPTPSDANWDWYKDYWKEGKTGFYMYQTYGGFNQNSEMADMADPWGCVAFPKGPKGKRYVTIVSDNITVIPNVYNQDKISKISMIYDLWTSPAPDWVEEEDFSGYEGLTDNNAIYETYAMLCDPANTTADLTTLLGTVNDVLGTQFLWAINENDLELLIQSASVSWESYLQTFNQMIQNMQAENGDTSTVSGGLCFDLDAKAKTAKVTGAKNKKISSVNVPATVKKGSKTYKVTTIGENAFSGNKSLKKVKLGKNVKTIGKGAFKGCTKLKEVSGGAGLVVIQDDVFSGCTTLAEITLNKKVASIGDNAFYNCKKLKKMIVKTTKLNEDVIGKKAFAGIYKKAQIQCPKEKLSAYKKLFVKRGAPKTCKFK